MNPVRRRTIGIIVQQADQHRRVHEDSEVERVSHSDQVRWRMSKEGSKPYTGAPIYEKKSASDTKVGEKETHSIEYDNDVLHGDGLAARILHDSHDLSHNL